MSTDIEKTGSAVPALHSTPSIASGLSADDVALSRIRIGQPQTPLVQDQVLPVGAIYATLDRDDPDPEVLWSPKDKNAEPLVFHVLDIRKGLSITIDGELVRFDIDDPDAPADAWRTFDYTVCLPGHDADMPYRWLFTRTATPSAKKINSHIARNAARGPGYMIAFSATTIERKKDQYRWYIPQLSVVDATQEGIDASAKLAEMVVSSSVESAPATTTTGGDEPAI